MLETIREFASERLEQVDEAESLERRHATYFVERAARLDAESYTMHGAERRRWVERHAADFDNLRRAFEWAARVHDREVALRLVGRGPLVYAGTVPDGLQLVERALAIDGSSSPTFEAAALQRGGQLAFECGESDRSRTLLEQSLARYRVLGDDVAVADTLADLAQTEANLGDVERARAHLRESIRVSRRIESTDRLAGALHSLGEMERDYGRYAAAEELLEEALELRNRAADFRGAGYIRHGLGDIRLEQGDVEGAELLYATTLAYYRTEDDKRSMAYALGGLAAAAAARGAVERAAKLWSAVEQIEEERGARLRSFERYRYRRFLDTLEPDAFAREVEAARTLELEQTIDFALAGAPAS